MTPLLAVHVLAGGVGLLSGAAALAARKGGRAHRASGKVFLAAMATMAAAAAALSVGLPDWANLPGALFALYLVATGWATVARPGGWGRPFDLAALALALGVAALAGAFALRAAADPGGLFAGKPAPLYGVFAGLATFAAAMDLRRLLRGPAAGPPRLARHVWRLCTALFFASGSFFMGQQKVMPEALRGSPALLALALAPLALMALWLVRVRLGRRFGGVVPLAS